MSFSGFPVDGTHNSICVFFGLHQTPFGSENHDFFLPSLRRALGLGLEVPIPRAELSGRASCSLSSECTSPVALPGLCSSPAGLRLKQDPVLQFLSLHTLVRAPDTSWMCGIHWWMCGIHWQVCAVAPASLSVTHPLLLGTLHRPFVIIPTAFLSSLSFHCPYLLKQLRTQVKALLYVTGFYLVRNKCSNTEARSRAGPGLPVLQEADSYRSCSEAFQLKS